MARKLYFVAQTGVLTRTQPTIPGNYYVYRVDAKHQERIKREVESAVFDFNGLSYFPGFLEWLETVDEACVINETELG